MGRAKGRKWRVRPPSRCVECVLSVRLCPATGEATVTLTVPLQGAYLLGGRTRVEKSTDRGPISALPLTSFVTVSKSLGLRGSVSSPMKQG